jgi:2-keto-4-pentenoate hydratase/2-oxohepta-3-ene-1,7-dioic acid hydratase in catechol pathway
MSLPELALGTVRIDPGGHPAPVAGGTAVLLRGGRLLVLDSAASALGLATPVTVRDVLADWARLRPLLDSADGTWVELDDVLVLPPVAPRQVIQAGANYRTHVMDLAVKGRSGEDPDTVRAETGAMMDRRAAEGEPYFFLGLPTVISGPYDDVVLPAYSQKHDWELELAAVIGATAFQVTPQTALEHVAGYTIVNDLTTRDLVYRQDMPRIGTDWFRGKNAPGFLPTGPWVVPADLVGDPQDLRITLTLNGDVMQDESTKDMLFGVARLVAAASQTVPLLPGDLLLTGSPAGNGIHHGRLLRAGDVMVSTITGLGVQRTTCVAPQPHRHPVTESVSESNE